MKSMRSTTLVASLCLAASLPAVAQDKGWKPMLDRGTQELSVSGRLEFPDFEEFNYDLDGSYGYFIRNGWEIGARLGASDFGGVDRVDVGLFTEYNFNRQTWWVPYIGAAIGVASVSFDDGNFDASTELDDDEGAIFDIESGIKWFVRPYMAISTAINFKFATDDIFATDNSLEDNLTSIKVGMRFYF